MIRFEKFDIGDTGRYSVFAVLRILISVYILILNLFGGPMLGNSMLDTLIDTRSLIY